MTLQEWSAEISKELIAAGFQVEDYKGFPLVKMPPTHEECVRFIEFSTNLLADRRIYAEGCLFLPAGSGRFFGDK